MTLTEDMIGTITDEGLVCSCGSRTCDNLFVSKTLWGQYCSKNCKQREGYHKRKKARQGAKSKAPAVAIT